MITSSPKGITYSISLGVWIGETSREAGLLAALVRDDSRCERNSQRRVLADECLSSSCVGNGNSPLGGKMGD